MAPVPAAADRQLSVEQAAKLASVHPETIRRALRTGELKASKNRLAPGSPYVIALAELRGFIAKRTA